MRKIVSFLIVIALFNVVVGIFKGDDAAEKDNANTSGGYSQVQSEKSSSYSDVHVDILLEDDDKPTTCWTCYGDGICNWCDGSGKYEYYPDWAGTTCRSCNGTGKCSGCNGKGVYD